MIFPGKGISFSIKKKKHSSLTSALKAVLSEVNSETKNLV